MPALTRRMRTPLSPSDEHQHHLAQEPLDHHPPPHHHHLHQQQEVDGMQSPPLQPGLRKLKKGDKDKLKNRMSMAFRKPFLNKDKNKSPDLGMSPPPVTGPPAYSYAPPGLASSNGSSSLNDRRRSSGGGGSQSKPGRSNKPQQHPSEGMVPRRSHVGAGAVGTSPPLPPLPRNGSIEGPSDPRVTALLSGGLGAGLGVNDLLPHNSFGPAFEVPTLEGLGNGLGIGIEQSSPERLASPPMRQPTPPSASRSPPPQLRVHSPPPHQQHAAPPPQQLHHQHSHPSLRSGQEQQHQGMPVLARPVTAPAQPEGQTYLTRRLSMIAAGQGESAASKRLSMMRRGPPVFSDSSANSSTTTLETAAATAQRTVEHLSHSRPTSPPAPPPQQPAPVALISSPPHEAAALAPPPQQEKPTRLLDEDEVGELSSASRDRIAKLRTARSSVSGPTPTPAQVIALQGRGANRRDATKAYTMAGAPAGFDISLIKSGKSTFTPLKPLPSPASSIARSSPLNPAAATKPAAPPQPQPAPVKPIAVVAPPPPPAATKDMSMYVLRPTVTMSTQTPNWDDFRSPRQAAAYGQSSMSTPPLAYASFPAPPPPPPHDSPPLHLQRPNISPSIYSVASFDARSRNIRAPGRAGRSSFYANGEVPEEEDEYGYEDQPPLPDESAQAIERHSMAFEHGYQDEEQEHMHDEEEDVAPTPVNYDIPYLPADPYDTPHLRPYEIPATPLAVPHRSDPSLAASPAMTASGHPTPRVEEATPMATPTAYAAPVFSTAQPFLSNAMPAVETLEIPESPRSNSRSRSPSPAPDRDLERQDEHERERTGSIDSSAGSSVSAAGSSALSDRRTSSEVTTPPTSAVSSMFPQHVEGNGDSSALQDGSDIEDAPPVVMIRKASIVTSQVRKASLVSVTPPSSRPQSVVLRKGSMASLSNAAGSLSDKRLSFASSDGGSPSVGRDSPRGRSPKQLQFHLDLPDGEEIPPIPAVPSPIRREYGEAAFPFPLNNRPTITSEDSPAEEAKEKDKEMSESDVAPTPRAISPPQPVVDSPAALPDTSIAIHSPSPSPARVPSPAPSAPPSAAPLFAHVDFDAARPASAPPEEPSALLTLRRHSEADKPIPRARTPGGMMSREERAAKGRSYFLVQALMGEAQPEGMIRDWAKAEGESDDDDVSILAGGSESEDDDLSDFGDE